jgi:integrase
MTLEAARQKAIQHRAQMVLTAEDPFASRKENILTLREYSQTYLNGYAKANKRPHSIEDDECGLRIYILPVLGHMKLNVIHRRDVAALHYSLSEKPYRANRVLALLSKIFNLAIDDGYRTDNPVKGIKHYHEESRTRWLNSEELSKLVTVLKAEENQLSATAVLFLMATGARKMEALSAKWEHFNLESKLWIKPADITKQKRTHIVELSDYAISLLDSIKDRDSEFVFYNSRLKMPLKDLKTFWDTVRVKAGLDGVRIHDLRHTYASMLINEGYSLEVVGELLGHSNLETTRRYAHLLPSTRRGATDRVGTVLKNVESNVESKHSKIADQIVVIH